MFINYIQLSRLNSLKLSVGSYALRRQCTVCIPKRAREMLLVACPFRGAFSVAVLLRSLQTLDTLLVVYINFTRALKIIVKNRIPIFYVSRLYRVWRIRSCKKKTTRFPVRPLECRLFLQNESAGNERLVMKMTKCERSRGTRKEHRVFVV